MILCYHENATGMKKADDYMIEMISRHARHGQRIFFYCSKKSKPQHRQTILEHNNGAWPIGLKLVTPEYEREISDPFLPAS